MNIHKESTSPLFEQVKEDIYEKIKNGIYVAGHKIPTELDLIDQYQVNHHQTGHRRIVQRRDAGKTPRQGDLRAGKENLSQNRAHC